eukprot:1157160-Pelagomonas_calceolata.AAC.5
MHGRENGTVSGSAGLAALPRKDHESGPQAFAKNGRPIAVHFQTTSEFEVLFRHASGSCGWCRSSPLLFSILAH